MKKLLNFSVLAILGLALTFAACDKDEVIVPVIEHPILTVVNHSFERDITGVSLVGYEFDSLNISWRDSQAFLLEKGMPSGYEDINVTVRFSGHRGGGVASDSIIVDFKDGEQTVITLNAGQLESGS